MPKLLSLLTIILQVLIFAGAALGPDGANLVDLLGAKAAVWLAVSVQLVREIAYTIGDLLDDGQRNQSFGGGSILGKLGMIALLLLGLSLLAGPARAQEIPVVGPACRAVFTPSISPSVVAYDVFVGTTPGAYGPPVRVAVSELEPAPAGEPAADRALPLCARMGLTVDGRYFTTLKTVNAVGMVSEVANEAPFDLLATAPAAASNIRVVNGPGA